MIRERDDLPDAIAFVHGDSIHVRSRTDALSVSKVDVSGEADVDIENSKNESAEDDDEKSLELLDFLPKTLSVPEKE